MKAIKLACPVVKFGKDFVAHSRIAKFYYGACEAENFSQNYEAARPACRDEFFCGAGRFLIFAIENCFMFLYYDERGENMQKFRNNSIIQTLEMIIQG